MPAKRVTRASTRAALATAANPPIAPANIPAPLPIPVIVNAPPTVAANGPSPRRTRSGKILGMMRTVATKLTRPHRAAKAVPVQEAVVEAAETIHVVPTTSPATVPQPPAPPRKRGGKAVKRDENEVQIAANDATTSSNSEPTPAPIPAPSERPIERTKSTRSLTSKDKGKARELPIENDQTPLPVVEPVPSVPVPAAPAFPKSPKPVEDIERVTSKLRILNATLLADDKIQFIENKWESCVHDNAKLHIHNIPKPAARLYFQRKAQAQQAARARMLAPIQATARVGPQGQGRASGHPPPQPRSQPPAASTSRGAGPSNAGLAHSPLKREGAVDWGHPEYYKERIRKAKEAGRSLAPIDLDYPAPDELPVASTSSTVPSAPSTVPSASSIVPSAPSTVPSASSIVPSTSSTIPSAPSTVLPVSSTVPSTSSTVPSTSATVPSASASRTSPANGPAPSGNGSATPTVESNDPRRIQRWNAVIFGYPEGHTPRNPWPESWIDPTGISTYPDAVRDASGRFVRPSRASASVAFPATRAAPPQTTATISVPPAAAPIAQSPTVSTCSNESADLAEVEASISIDLDDGDAHPAADLLAPTAPSASNSNAPATTAAAAPRPPTLTRPRASSSNERGRELPPRRNDDEDAIVQQIVADVVREVEAERAARPPQQPAPRVQSMGTMGPPAPRTAASTSSRAHPGPIVLSENKPGRSSGISTFAVPPVPKTAMSAPRFPPIMWPEDKPSRARGSSGMSLFGAPAPKPAASSSLLLPPIVRPEDKLTGSSGMSLFGLAANAKGKGKATAPTTPSIASMFNGADAKGKGKAVPTTLFGTPQLKGTAVQKQNGRPPPTLFGTASDNKGKKRAREAEPEPAAKTSPAVQLWGYVSSTGPMKVRVSLVPTAPSPKRQRVSEAGGDATDTAPADQAVALAAEQARNESAPAPSEDQALPARASTQSGDGSAKRSRMEFEEGSSRADADLEDEDEDEDETRPAKKPRTGSQ